MRTRCASRILVLGLACSFMTSAAAQRDREVIGPSREVVQERLYQFDGRFDLSLMGGLSVNPKLIDHYAGMIQPAYHLTDAWAIELAGGYVHAQERQRLTNMVPDGIRYSIQRYREDGQPVHEFTDMGAMEWVAQAGVRWSPIYGKLNLASELPLHFGAYASVGAGVAGVQRTSLATCTAVSESAGTVNEFSCAEGQTAAVEPMGSGALGLRLYMNHRFALRTELKSFVYPDEVALDIGGDDPRVERGLTAVLMFLGGVSVYF